MNDLVIYPWNVLPLVLAASALLLAVYMARIPNKSAASKWLLVMIVLLILGMVWQQVGNVANNSDWEGWLFTNNRLGNVVDVLTSFVMAVGLLFAYLLGPQRFRAEQRWVVGGALLMGAFLAVRSSFFPPPAGFDLVTVLGSAVGQAVAASVLVRKALRARSSGQREDFNPKAYWAFAVYYVLPLILLPIFLGLNAIGAGVNLQVVTEFLDVAVWLLLAAIYLQFAPEPTSLGAKFVGAALIAVFVMTQLTAVPMNTESEIRLLYAPVPLPHTLELIPTGDGGYRAEGRVAVFHAALGDSLDLGDDTQQAVAAEFPLEAYGRAYDSLYVWSNGMVAFGPRADSLTAHRVRDPYDLNYPNIAVLYADLNPTQGGAVWYHSTADSLMITWAGVPLHDAGNDDPLANRTMNAQLVIRRGGGFQSNLGEMAYRPQRWSRGISPGGLRDEHREENGRDLTVAAKGNLILQNLPITVGPGEALIREEGIRNFQAWGTTEALRLLRNTFVVFALILILVPLFYRTSVRRRVSRLMEGLQRVNSGDLDAQIDVYVHDEVGQLSTSFNSMTGALREARASVEKHARELEGRVETRTADLTRTVEVLQATQAQLVEQEKLASLGALTAGIAHEIKNPLNFVNNFAEVNAELATEADEALAAGDVEAAREALKDLEANSAQIAKHGKRADSIVRSMMMHARGGASEREKIEVNTFINEYIDLAWHGMRARSEGFRTEVVRDFAPDTGSLSVLPQELGRVILNLLNNAFDALRDEENPTVTVSTARSPEGVQIRISDNGPGIPVEIREKIFEPFFTTKATGEGTGLGLSLSYDIVTKAHGGTMTAGATRQGGAEFLISLPQ
jgi:signal transduction histidine kinase